MSEKDYRKLYQVQDKILVALKPVFGSFYLTGGTALGRFRGAEKEEARPVK